MVGGASNWHFGICQNSTGKFQNIRAHRLQQSVTHPIDFVVYKTIQCTTTTTLFQLEVSAGNNCWCHSSHGIPELMREKPKQFGALDFKVIDIHTKGAPARKSRTWSWLVSPAVGREKNFGHPTISAKKK